MQVRWQEEVLNSTFPITIAKVARGGGKTFTAMQWARNQYGKRVMFISRSVTQSELAARVMARIYEDEIMSATRDQVIFRDGTTITFKEAWDNFRGYMSEALVVDDVESLTTARWNEITYRISGGKMLVVGTKLSDPVEIILEDREATTNYVVADYQDLMKDNLYSIDFVDSLGRLESYIFKQEFGPWRKPKEMNNEDYLFLLQT